MATLASHGTLKIKNVNAKNITLETDDSANVVELKTSSNSANYGIVLPAAAPTVKEQALQADITDQTVLNWSHIVNYQHGIDVTDPAVNTDNGRFFADTSAETIYFRINDTWKPVNNWLSTVNLGTYSASIETNAIHHETSVDRFYFPSPTSSAWYRLTTTSYSTPKFVDMDPSHTVFLASNNNFRQINDGFGIDLSIGSGYINGVKVIKDWVGGFPAYIEWEYLDQNASVNWAVTTSFGWVEKTLDPTFTNTTSNWGINVKMTRNDGISVILGDAGSVDWQFNELPTNGTDTLITSTFPTLKYGDRVQFFADSTNGKTEVVFCRDNNPIARSIKVAAIGSSTDKVYYASSLGQVYRVSTKPRRYMGTLSPSTYILNYD